MTAPEDRGDPRLVQEVRRLVKTGDRSALLEYITAPPPDELAEAATWFSKGGRTLLTQDLDWRLHGSISLADLISRSMERESDSHSRSMVREMVTVAVSAPADAARFLPWREMAWSSDLHILVLLDVLVSRGDDWCRRFVAAAISRNASAGQGRANTVIRCCLPLILHFGVSTADFEAYPRLWAFYYRDLVGGRIREAFRIGPAGSAVVFPKMQKSLLELWDQDVTAATTLLRCFEVPDALGPLAMQLAQKEWTVGAAVRGYLDRGTFRREEVFGKLRTALTRDDGLPTQRVLADVLKSCQPGPEEVAASIPLLLSTVATAPGFLSTQALGLLLSAPLTGDDLAELSAVVFGRTGKKPQEQLVKHLKAERTAGTYDDGVLAACWDAAAGSSDLKIRSIAGDMLAATGPSGIAAQDERGHDASAPGGPVPASLWGTGASEPNVSPPYVPLDPVTVRFSARWQRTEYKAITEEQELEALLRLAYRQPQEGRDWYRKRYPPRDPAGYLTNAQGLEATKWVFWGDASPETAMWMWASACHDLPAHRHLVSLLHASLSGPPEWGDPFRRVSPVAAVHTLRLSELTVQAGTVSYSLATPSYLNHKLELDRLVATLRVYAEHGWRYGEADFFQALLRLGPFPAERAAGIPDLPVLPLDGSDDPQRAAGTLLRRWIQAGGFVPPPVDSPLVLPVPPEWFPSIPRQLLEPAVWDGGTTDMRRIGWAAAHQGWFHFGRTLAPSGCAAK